ncbi:LysR family transcriptional regulator [Acinetobacter sp. B51(2017)]|uniref:LysR family transcriptional regulator n=1 Tax=Acinetobacter sp. B51(2017) TaxID=2060938 RepID=UPI000F0792E4|nr:LysR family transcriptional regulator [Acinetobacter sp. B51(2017)]
MHKIHNLDLKQLSRLDLNLYPLFIAVYQYQSISQAAHHLCMSQSAASHALQRLRQQLQDPLFVRVGQKMQPTPLASLLYPNILSSVQTLHALHIQQLFQSAQLRHLRCAIHDEIETFVLAKIYQHFSQLHPHIHIESFKLQRKQLIKELERQQIDFAIDFGPNLYQGLNFSPLFEDELVVCTQQPHLELSTYLNAAHIGVSSRRSGILVEDVLLQAQQIYRQVILRCQHYRSALQIVAVAAHTMLTLPKNTLTGIELPAHVYLHPLPITLAKISIGLYHSSTNQARQQFIVAQMQQIFAH